MKSFHYRAISTGSIDLYPDSKGGKFRNNTTSTINLEGQWKVGMSYLICKAQNATHLDATDEFILLQIVEVEKNPVKLNSGTLSYKVNN